MKPQSLANVFWGLTRLEHQPVFLSELISKCHAQLQNFELKQLCSALYCLSKLPRQTKEVQAFQEDVVALVSGQVHNLGTTTEIICVATSLARSRKNAKIIKNYNILTKHTC